LSAADPSSRPAPLRILQTNFHRGWGGQPSRILMMSRVLAERGHKVTLAVPRGSMLAVRGREAGLEVFDAVEFRKPKFLLHAARDVAVLAGHLRDRRYDLIDAHGSQDVWTCVAARRLSGRTAPLVFTRHNTKRVRSHALNGWLYGRQVDHLIAVSQSVLERYEPLFKKGHLTPERVSVVPSAYRPDRFHPGISGARVRRELGVGPEVPLIGVVGRLVADKGQDDLLRAAPLILKSKPEARLLLVGIGSRESYLKDLAASLDLDRAVRFLGFRDDVPEITAALNVSVLPSIDCDASSAVLKEALACGVPAVATSIGGAAEILEDGRTGLIVPPRNPERLALAILSLLDDPERARDMGRRGSRDVAERFSPERLGGETLEVYNRVVERFQRSRR
jgi:glycosyltransferase involved in cell wall biosynthesis